MEKDFLQFYKQLPEEMRQNLDNFGISSFEDFLGLAVMMGVDLDKFLKSMEDGSLASGKVKFEDLLSEEGSYMREQGYNENDHSEDDPFAFPKNCFIEEENPRELHLRIKLLDSPIPVWREIKVPSDVTLEYFAFIINSVMGWGNIHLHQFTTKDAQYKNTECLMMDRQMDFGFNIKLSLDSNVFPISHFFKEKKDRIKYEYDFGDSWVHEIWLKGVREYESDEVPGLKVLKGKGACPPEDCGGVWGYADLLEIKAKMRNTKEERERLEWFDINKHDDLEFFDIDFAQEELDDIWMMAIMND